MNHCLFQYLLMMSFVKTGVISKEKWAASSCEIAGEFAGHGLSLQYNFNRKVIKTSNRSIKAL